MDGPKRDEAIMGEYEASKRPVDLARDRLTLEYIKSNLFRVAHVDGAIGGPTPTGHIHLAVFSERPAIPRRQVARIENGVLTEPVPEETVVREGMIREMDIDLVMSVAVAEELSKLLTNIAAEIKKSLQNKKPEGETS